MKKRFPLFLIACLAAVPAVLSADSVVVEEIIARVNTQIITRSEYLREKEQLKQEVQQQEPGNADKAYAEREKDVLRGLIDQDLLLDKGKDLGITADTDLIKRLDEIRKQMNLESMEDLEKAAQVQGVSFEDFKQNLRNSIITQKVIGQEVGSHIQVTKEEEQKFYDQHKDELQQPETVRLSEILISTQKAVPGDKAAPADPDAQQLAAAEAKAKDLLDQIQKGASFEDVAKKNSDGPTAAQGGDLGEFKRGVLSKELEDKTFAMKPGEVSEVIRTKQGFVILKVTEHAQAGVPPLKDVAPKVQEALYMQKLQPALREYLSKLREDAFIDVKGGYVDTGASAKQTKPVETTVKEASAKKLKKKKKFGLF
ncbi:MAG: peptidylprolyl isomerase [Acidobacteria bacterium]|nr:MAG: peptidylprolyl isomerase [Acidobacteriota bacterium]PYY09433.1 MAG: peptidylprolyl isomerase [Acidobacteriota bacterium]